MERKHEERVMVALSAKIRDRLKILAAIRRVSIRELIEEILTKALAKAERIRAIVDNPL
jgi:predicted HicB family RNase H-like nuclease